MNATTTTTDDPRVAKIMALLSKTEERGCTPEEAEAAFSAAQRLMTKWAIDEAILNAANGKKAEERIVTDRSVVVKGGYVMQLGTLWKVVAEANDCHMLWSKYNSRATIIIAGYESDVKRVLLLGTSLMLQLLREIRAGKPAYDEWDHRSRGMQAYIWRRSFAEGWVSAVGRRLREARQSAVDETKRETGQDLLPALIDRRKTVEQFVRDELHPRAGRASRQSYNWSGAAAGKVAGAHADLGHSRVGGGKKALGR